MKKKKKTPTESEKKTASHAKSKSYKLEDKEKFVKLKNVFVVPKQIDHIHFLVATAQFSTSVFRSFHFIKS